MMTGYWAWTGEFAITVFALTLAAGSAARFLVERDDDDPKNSKKRRQTSMFDEKQDDFPRWFDEGLDVDRPESRLR